MNRLLIDAGILSEGIGSGNQFDTI